MPDSKYWKGQEMDNAFNENLRRIRKEKGITQEQLADAVGVSAQAVSKWEQSSYPDAQLLPAVADFLEVTIDELFGRNCEKVSIYESVVRHIRETPPKEQFSEAVKICRAFPVAMCGTPHYQPIPEDIVEGRGWHNYSQITFQEGFLQMRNNGDLQYFILMPEPECGYDEVLAYNEKMVRLFQVLAIPNALRAMYFLVGRDTSMFFRHETLTHELGISMENARQIISGLIELGFIWEATLNGGSSAEKIYQYISSCDFVSFMNFARLLLDPPNGFSYQSAQRSGKRYFIKDTYKKQGGQS